MKMNKMPTYVYQCLSCLIQYEQVQQMIDKPDKVCQNCGKETATRVFQPPALTAAATPTRQQQSHENQS